MGHQVATLAMSKQYSIRLSRPLSASALDHGDDFSHRAIFACRIICLVAYPFWTPWSVLISMVPEVDLVPECCHTSRNQP